jgi:tRNA A-37 threonylcarbamoyl transferase component Bud32/tetratricopeptide (TPR) repeat protein
MFPLAGAISVVSNQDTEERLREALAKRYWIESEIGSGGMATVYLAQDLKHNRRVAVKVLNPELAQSLGAERFLREIETAANLRHPHILPLFDSGEAEGFLFYVMPYVKGESLRSRLTQEKQLPVEDAIQITREIADALAYAHEEGVIHRDVKPANIMLEAGHAVLADFGIAHAVAEAKDQRLTRTGTSLGTPGYMSPEQAMGEEDLDGRSDQYALGCVLYEMLAGHPPFTGVQVEAVVRQHLTEQPPPVTKARPTVTTQVAEVISKALSKSPPDRYKTAGEMAAALALTTTPTKERSPLARTKAMIYAGTVILGLATIAVIASIWPISRSEAGGTLVAVMPFENRTGDPSLDALGSMAANEITDGITGVEWGPINLETVPSQQVQAVLSSASRGAGDTSADDPINALADETGAGLLISGWYYTEGESLHFQAEIYSPEDGRTVESVQTRGVTEDQTRALEVMQDRVVGALGINRYEAAGIVPEGRFRPPPAQSAIGPWMLAERAFTESEYATAVSHYDRALELDPGFVWARLRQAIAYQNLHEPAAADSVLQLLEPQRDQLSGHNRMWFDLRRAQFRNDRLASLDASWRLLRADPDDRTVRYNVGLYALTLNRPGEAIEVLLPLSRTGSWYNFWNVLASSYHFLGEHEEELDVARRGREAYPDEIYALEDEVEALAAMGRVGEVNRLLDEALTFSDGSPGEVMLTAALEFRAHGYADEAGPVLERAISWYQNRTQREMEPERLRFEFAQTLFAAERWAEANAIIDELAADDPKNLNYQGYLGSLAARQDNFEEATRIDRALADLDDQYLGGLNHAWRARIAAVMGEKDRAVDLLREGHAKGLEFWMPWHRDPDLMLLRGHPPFDEFMRPKG